MTTVTEYDLWDQPVHREEEWCVFHDESIPNKRWLLIGLLFVREKDVEEAKRVLRQARQNENYEGEIHFSALPKSFGGQYGAKARVARSWLEAYQDHLCERVFFSCLAVDRHSPKYKSEHFPKDFHAYNRFTAMALKAGIAWHLVPRNLNCVVIHFVSDKKDRQTRPDEGWQDNFEQYLPYRAGRDVFSAQVEGRNYPLVKKFRVELRDSKSEDLLQLTDLLLGAMQEALVSGSSRATKQELGKMVLRWCEDIRKKPREQQYALHRKFNVWAFPDEQGRPYNNVRFALDANPNQLRLFEA